MVGSDFVIVITPETFWYCASASSVYWASVVLDTLFTLTITLSIKPVSFCPGGSRRDAEIVSGGRSEGSTSRISQEDGYWKVIPDDGSVYERALVLFPPF